MSKKRKDDDVWCCCCGDRTYYAALEGRDIEWFKIDNKRGIGICLECSKVVEKRNLVLPANDEENENA